MKPDLKQKVRELLEGMSLFTLIEIYIFIQFKRIEWFYQKIQIKWIELMVGNDK